MLCLHAWDALQCISSRGASAVAHASELGHEAECSSTQSLQCVAIVNTSFVSPCVATMMLTPLVCARVGPLGSDRQPGQHQVTACPHSTDPTRTGPCMQASACGPVPEACARSLTLCWLLTGHCCCERLPARPGNTPCAVTAGVLPQHHSYDFATPAQHAIIQSSKLGFQANLPVNSNASPVCISSAGCLTAELLPY